MARGKRGAPRRPTESELEILRILWHRGPSTVRQVHGELKGHEGIGYTTALKFLQIMHEKGLVRRDESARAHVYAPAVDKENVQRDLLSDFIGHVFEGSTTDLVMQALGSADPASRRELSEIRRLLDNIDKSGSE